MAVNDVYQLRHVMRDFDNKIIQNVYFYRQQSDGVGGPYPTQAERLGRDWLLDVFPSMRGGIPANFITTEIAVTSLFNAADAYVVPTQIAGTRTPSGDQMPTFLGVKVTLQPSNAAVKKGRKIFAGVYEGDQAAGLLNSNALTIFNFFAGAMLIGVSNIIGGRAFWPVIVKRIAYTTPAGKPAYRLPATISELVYGNVNGSVLSGIVTTQNSRKD